MQQHQHDEPGGIEGLKRNLGRGIFICECLAATVIVFLHRGFGPKWGTVSTAIGALLIFLFMAFGAPHSPVPTMLFLGAYILMLASVRIKRARANARGEPRHSRYNGYPRLARFFPNLDEVTIKNRIEPVFVGLVGFAMLFLSPPLGCYLIAASFGLAVSVSSVIAYDNAKAMQAVDAMIESRMHAERVRQRVGTLLN